MADIKLTENVEHKAAIRYEGEQCERIPIQPIHFDQRNFGVQELYLKAQAHTSEVKNLKKRINLYFTLVFILFALSTLLFLHSDAIESIIEKGIESISETTQVAILRDVVLSMILYFVMILCLQKMMTE